jgi:hypothetical protein
MVGGGEALAAVAAGEPDEHDRGEHDSEYDPCDDLDPHGRLLKVRWRLGLPQFCGSDASHHRRR